MTYLEAMRRYYQGQHSVALAGAAVAVLYLALAYAVYARNTRPARQRQAARSFAVTVFVFAGLLMLPANVIYLFDLGPQSAKIQATLARSPSQFDALENAHLDSMMDGFRLSYTLDSAIAFFGLIAIAIGFASESRKAVGIGLGVILCATTLLAGEVWSKQRALRYRQQLHAAGGIGHRGT
jgi:multisubunit Na+/H+ antiporter MnhB subunit